MIPDALHFSSISQRPTVSGSLPDGTVVSSNSARYHRAHSGDTSGWHLLSGRLPGTVRHDTGNTMNAVFAHLPVMLEQITDVFSGMNDGVFLDATLGGAGHSTAILTAHPHVSLLGIDQDDMALDSAEQVLAAAGCSGRVALRRVRFDAAALIAAKEGISALSGALFDLGVSSPQFDVAERGFSYRFDAPLDMRMDRTQALSADVIVNTYDEDALTSMLRRNADERHAFRIAKAIIAARPIHSTFVCQMLSVLQSQHQRDVAVGILRKGLFRPFALKLMLSLKFFLAHYVMSFHCWLLALDWLFFRITLAKTGL